MISVNRNAAGRQFASGQAMILGICLRINLGISLVLAIAFPAIGQVQAPELILSTDYSGQFDRLTELAQTQPPKAFEQALGQAIKPLNKRQRSHLLKQLLLSLRDSEPSAAGHWLIEHVSQGEALYLQPHPEGAAFDHDPVGLSAVAQGTRNAWVWKQWQQRVIESGRQRQWQLLAELSAKAGSIQPEDKAALLGASAGIDKLEVSTLNHPDLLNSLIKDAALKPLTLNVVRRTGDTELLAKAMAHWPSADQQSVALTLDRWIGVNHALVVWQELLQQASPQSIPARDALKRVLRGGKLSPEQDRQVNAALEVKR